LYAFEEFVIVKNMWSAGLNSYLPFQVGQNGCGRLIELMGTLQRLSLCDTIAKGCESIYWSKLPSGSIVNGEPST